MRNVELIVRALHDNGVRWVFGIPSGPVLPLIEALRASPVEFILTASETSAAFMASTVGYLTGVPGVCVSTVGPGATNLTTGVGCAWLDRCPAIAITCNVGSQWLQRRVQMRIDHQALFRPLTKASFSAADAPLSEILPQLFEIATKEPPGPVHLDLPEDIAQFETTETHSHRRDKPKNPGCFDVAEAVGAALEKSQRPLLITGLSFTRASARAPLHRFVERQNLPFVTTLHGKGFLPESDSHWAGVIGRARRTDVKSFTDKADLIIAVGYDPIEINYEDWAGATPIIHISTEAAEPSDGLNLIWNRACNLDAAIEALSELREYPNAWTVDEWSTHRRALDQSLRRASGSFGAQAVIDLLREKLPAEGILAYDVGAHTHQIATQWKTDLPKTLLATNGWSSMGYGMPAAYAAKLVYPDRPVACVVGDGGFQMTAGELALARRMNLALPVIVLNDGWLGLMKIKQERKKYPLSGVRLGDPPESPPHYFGVPCRSAKTLNEFRDALAWAFASRTPTVIEAFIDVESYSQTVFD